MRSVSASRSIICLVATSAILAGCGESTKTTSTSASTSAPASTPSAPAVESPPTTSPSTSSTKTQPASTATQPKPAETTAQVKPPSPPKAAEVAKPVKSSEETGALAKVPLKKQWPRILLDKFLNSCEAGKGSLATCECVLVKQELAPVEQGLAVAEVLVFEGAVRRGVSLEQAIHHAVPLPGGVRLSLEQCVKTGGK